ncbi:MAG: hypothetical protein K2O54_00765 [Prevotella sp.]|nr:hypothetical protein [Prevotella sp.]
MFDLNRRQREYLINVLEWDEYCPHEARLFRKSGVILGKADTVFQTTIDDTFCYSVGWISDEGKYYEIDCIQAKLAAMVLRHKK